MSLSKNSALLLAAALVAGFITNSRLLAAPTASAESVGKSPAISFYTVDHYDPNRDAMADVQDTMKRAVAENKRILLQIGGNWCGWCHVLSRKIENSPELRDALTENFLVMKVSVDDLNPNHEFLSHLPPVNAFPHWFILESDGKLLRSQDPTPFESARGYSSPAILKFLNEMAPEKE